MFTPKFQGPDKRGSRLIVLSQSDTVPLEFSGLVTQPGLDRAVVRIAGGCKGFSPELLSGLQPYFVAAFEGFSGSIFSGGTANVYGPKDAEVIAGTKKVGDLKTDQVTNIPGLISQANPCLAIHSTPRTAVLAMNHRDGGVVCDNYGGQLDYRGGHGHLVVEQDPANVLGWDGDLEMYLNLLEGWKSAGFAVGIIVLNGGDVTRDEIYKGLKRGIPVIVVEGSLREADAFVKAFRDGDFSLTGKETRDKAIAGSKPTTAIDAAIAQCKEDLAAIDRSLVSIVPVGDAAALRAVLLERGILKAPETAAAATPQS